jgi:hypothetical protein
MNAITGTVKNGHVVLDNPLELSEGARVLVELLAEAETFGVREADWQDSPEAIAEWIRWYESLEPLELTPQEEADWQAERQADKARQKAAFEERAEELRRIWD